MRHPLKQRINKLGLDSQQPTVEPFEECSVGDFLSRLNESLSDLELVKTLRKFLNTKAKSRKSSLPNRIDVTMTVVATTCFVFVGGDVNGVMSLAADDLAARLEMLANKDWIPDPIQSMIQRCRAWPQLTQLDC